MQIIFLGTSCAKPTKERNHSAIFLSYGSDGILFDCGEGTQRQITIAGIKPTKINKVFISHWHGDHSLGLPGLIQTLSLSEYNQTLKIYGPKGTKQRINKVLEAFVFENRIKLDITELKSGDIITAKDYLIHVEELNHKTPTIGFRFVEKDKRNINLQFTKKLGIPEGPLLGKLQDGESVTWKGKKITPKQATNVARGKIFCYLPDSTTAENSIKLAENADILVCESTYTSKLEEKAEEYFHMTARQAGEIANQANVKQLILTHFSPRYKDAHELEEDARNVFDNVLAAKDFMKINL